MNHNPSRRISRRFSSRRVWGLIAKESRQILRDPSSVLIAFVFPCVLLLLFGYGVSLDAKHLKVAVVVEQPDETTASYTASFLASRYFAPRVYRHRWPAERDLLAGKVQAAVVLRSSFSQETCRNLAAPVQLLVDGTDANMGNLVIGYVQELSRSWHALRTIENCESPAIGVHPEFRVWFNPEVRSTNFLVPGLTAVIMTLIGALLTSLLVAREYDRGTIEALLATPARIGEVLLAKLVPTFFLGMGGMVVAVAMALWLFGVPFRGSFWVLAICSSLFMAAALGMGLLISTASKNQFVAGQVAIMATYLPAFLLSDFVFNLASAPEWVRAISRLVAARYFVAILKSVFLAGDVWAIVLPNAGALALMAAVFFVLSRFMVRRRLD